LPIILVLSRIPGASLPPRHTAAGWSLRRLEILSASAHVNETLDLFREASLETPPTPEYHAADT